MMTQSLSTLRVFLIGVLAAEHPEIVKQLAAQWRTWADRVEALRHGQPKRK